MQELGGVKRLNGGSDFFKIHLICCVCPQSKSRYIFHAIGTMEELCIRKFGGKVRVVEAEDAVARGALRAGSPEPGSEEEKPVVLIQADRKQSASHIPERPELPCGRLVLQVQEPNEMWEMERQCDRLNWVEQATGGRSKCSKKPGYQPAAEATFPGILEMRPSIPDLGLRAMPWALPC